MDSEAMVNAQPEQIDTRSEPTNNPIEDPIKTVFDPVNATSSGPIEPLEV
jgi:hypothetical protein